MMQKNNYGQRPAVGVGGGRGKGGERRKIGLGDKK